MLFVINLNFLLYQVIKLLNFEYNKHLCICCLNVLSVVSFDPNVML